jgi:hypothetical protein
MLRGMLDAHPELAVVYEPHVITELDCTAVRHGDGSLDVDRFAKMFVEHRWFRRWEMSPQDVDDALSAARPVYLSEALRCLYGWYARVRGKARCGDKSPSYVHQMIRVGELLPDARFVHLVRDGRDASDSLRHAPWGPRTMTGAAEQWRDWVEAGLRAGARLGAQRYLEVRYEHLVADPRDALLPVCRFLALPYDAEMLRFHERADDVRRHERPRYHDRLDQPVREGLRDWRRDLGADDLDAFDQVAGELTARLGYEPSPHRAVTR